ncbi:TatD family hydrolase [Picrophilus oshimae]|uniref:TatD-related deoxyribonuclease n=1 Tax=Picrophilus torridus (strain ATCC 700027 / DSM 9790 / JCM 10055 / NBRC 100828 / KAW 2/3) TaxID=1122961 RepID=A0A8G2FY22_PICTO|nr:TatD family hydrolase [Picrophilus oshimae]SMD31611.1 TatD-related deoxyribonuclease [Picrophilus oshimae DSM 9789]
MVVFDNFMHIRPSGCFIKAALRFKMAGGTALNLVNFPEHYLCSNYYEKLYNETIKTGKMIEEHLNVIITLGPYPLDYIYFKNSGKDPLKEMVNGIDLAVKIIKDGHADALGEIGTPHFNVDDDFYNVCLKVLDYALEASRDNKIPLIIHSEDFNCNGYKNLEDKIKRLGDINITVKHHANPNDIGCNDYLYKSIIASRSGIRNAINYKKPFMIETDYVDDKSKPGKVIPPESVPLRARMIRNSYDNHDEILNMIFSEVPYKIYKKDFFID